MSAPTWSAQAEGLYTPAILLYGAVSYFFQVILETAFKDPLGLLQIQKIRDEAFSRFWLAFSASPDPPPAPSELVGSAALVPPLLSTASGDVLELGPGSGAQMRYTTPSLIKTYHAAEPALGLHKELVRQANAAGLREKIKILPCGGEPDALISGLTQAGTLAEGKLEATFDTIICIRVLCSVKHPKDTMECLHKLLKPGGRLLTVEHVVNPSASRRGSVAARGLQAVYKALGWSFFVGDCCMDRDTEGMLKGIGATSTKSNGWEKVDLKLSFGWACLPYISGQLVKRSED